MSTLTLDRPADSVVTVESPGVMQVGPYQVTPDGDAGWFVLYIEDNDDDLAWHELLTTVPGFGHARLLSDAVLELDGQVRVCAEHWSQPSILDTPTDPPHLV